MSDVQPCPRRRAVRCAAGRADHPDADVRDLGRVGAGRARVGHHHRDHGRHHAVGGDGNPAASHGHGAHHPRRRGLHLLVAVPRRDAAGRLPGHLDRDRRPVRVDGPHLRPGGHCRRGEFRRARAGDVRDGQPVPGLVRGPAHPRPGGDHLDSAGQRGHRPGLHRRGLPGEPERDADGPVCDRCAVAGVLRAGAVPHRRQRSGRAEEAVQPDVGVRGELDAGSGADGAGHAAAVPPGAVDPARQRRRAVRCPRGLVTVWAPRLPMSR